MHVEGIKYLDITFRKEKYIYAATGLALFGLCLVQVSLPKAE